MIEAGCWCEPAHVVLQESRSMDQSCKQAIAMCQEHLRPVSLRELQDLGVSKRLVGVEALEALEALEAEHELR